MKYCYNCGKGMVNSDPKNIQADAAYIHGEHIIPNALRGKLITYSVLCQKCGGVLNSEIDVPFVKYFSAITEQLKEQLVKKDHGAKSGSNKVRGFLYSEKYGELAVDLHDFKIAPAHNPPLTEIDDEKKIVKVYTNRARANNYRNVLEKDFRAVGKNFSEYHYEVIEDMSALGVPYFPVGLEKMDTTEQNMVLFMGLNKIAIEFALHNGIEIELK